MSSSKKRLRSHPEAVTPVTPASGAERGSKSRKVAPTSRGGRSSAPSAPSSPATPTPSAPSVPASPAATSSTPSVEQKSEAFDPKDKRGYVATFNWKDHYPFGDPGPSVMIETPLVPSIPTLFFHIISTVTEVEKTCRGRDVLPELDRKIVKTVGSDGGRSDRKLILTSENGTEFVVNACRKEHVKLIYEGSDGGLLSKLGLCPMLIEVFSVSPGSKGQQTYSCVGGHSVDSSLACICSSLNVPAAAKSRSAKGKGKSMAPSPTPAVGDSDQDPNLAASSLTSLSSAAAFASAHDDMADAEAESAPIDEDSPPSYNDLAASSAFSEVEKAAEKETKTVSSSRKLESKGDIPKVIKVPKPRSGEETAMDVESSEDENEFKERDVSELTPTDFWTDLEKMMGSCKKSVEKFWKQKLREAERQNEILREQLREAANATSEFEQRWKEEKDTNVKLWERLDQINKTIDRMVRPLKKT